MRWNVDQSNARPSIASVGNLVNYWQGPRREGASGPARERWNGANIRHKTTEMTRVRVVEPPAAMDSA